MTVFDEAVAGGRRVMRRAAIGGTVAAVAALATPGHAATYTETFQTAPGGTGYAALLGSPNGVTYDMYPGRTFERPLGPVPVTIIGPGDEGFYWGNNHILPRPRYGLPGNTYSSDTTDYLLNGYGSGYPGWVLGINFATPTVVDSLGFGLANGSNAPAPGVTVYGLRSGAEVWARSTDIGGNVTVTGGSGAVDRIEIDRDQNQTALFGAIHVGWHTLDNLTYEISGAPSGDYSWRYYTRYDYLGALGSGTPEPATWALLLAGFGLVGSALRRVRPDLVPR